MALEIVTGYKGANHVTAEQIADANRAMFGDLAIGNVGSNMNIEVKSNTSVWIHDGVAFLYGREVYIPAGTYETITVEAGTSGKYRVDVVYFKYTKDSNTGVENVTLEIAKGSESSSSSSAYAPSIMNQNDIRDGVNVSNIPLCWLKLSGTSLSVYNRIIKPTPIVNRLNVETTLNLRTQVTVTTLASFGNSTGSSYSAVGDGLYYFKATFNEFSSSLGGKLVAIAIRNTTKGEDIVSDTFEIGSGNASAYTKQLVILADVESGDQIDCIVRTAASGHTVKTRLSYIRVFNWKS